MATVHAAGRTVRGTFPFEVSSAQSRQVFRSAPGLVRPEPAPALPVLWLALGGLGLLGTGFASAALLFRRGPRPEATGGEAA